MEKVIFIGAIIIIGGVAILSLISIFSTVFSSKILSKEIKRMKEVVVKEQEDIKDIVDVLENATNESTEKYFQAVKKGLTKDDYDDYVVCKSCGNEIKKGSKFCSNCGRKL